jgi:spectinomycin phosphotransferase
MLEKPDIQDSLIIACLRDAYGLIIVHINFLPIGADRNTAVFRAMSDDNDAYFVKLRSGDFDEMSILAPKLLHDQHNRHIIAPLPTRSQELWTAVGGFKLAVFPFVEGYNGYEIDLLDRHWVDFGQALKGIHSAQIPATVASRIHREEYADTWRERVREFQALVETQHLDDRGAAILAEFLIQKKGVVSDLVQRAEDLAAVLHTQSEPFVICHGDIHAGNVLIDVGQNLYLVDWDTLILAPKERDLMFVGGGQFVNLRSPEEEERLFYQGYGQTETNAVALAYYRYERIVQDIAAYCEEILLAEASGDDQETGLRQLTSQFRPHDVIEIASRSEAFLPEQYKTR